VFEVNTLRLCFPKMRATHTHVLACALQNPIPNEVPLRNDCIDPQKLVERTDEEAVEEAKEKGAVEVEYDTPYRHPAAPGSGKGADDRGYVVFTMEDRDALRSPLHPCSPASTVFSTFLGPASCPSPLLA
jgi:hypothetical protein